MSAGAGSAHMMTMDNATAAPQLMFPHDVPEIEPPVGTVAVFNSSFVSGAGASSGMLIRTEHGWSTDHRGRRDLHTWAELTDLDARNACILAQSPRSTSRFGAVQVIIVAAPLNGTGA